MPLDGSYEPSPNEFVANQVRQYEESGGREGNTLRGVVASMGGAPHHPVWYRNLTADAHVSVQDGSEVRDYVAREVTGDEKAEWWTKATAVWPDYDAYQAKTDREIPVVVLEPAGAH